MNNRQLKSISNGNMKVSFDKANGQLVSIVNSVTGNKYLNGKIEEVASSIEHDDCLKKALLDVISDNKGTEEEKV